jgi:hypothetical protein
MTALLERERQDEVLIAADPEALIAEARRRQRKRRLLIALIAAAAAAVGIAALLILGNSSTPSSATGAGAGVGQPSTLQLHLRGFGTSLPTQIDQGPCPQGRTSIEIQPSGSVIGCVLTIRKWDAPNYGVKKITQTARETYHLTGGTIVTLETQTIHFARDQHHTTALFSGRVIGGSGRFVHARGSTVGGGPGVDGRGEWTVTLHLSYR